MIEQCAEKFIQRELVMAFDTLKSVFHIVINDMDASQSSGTRSQFIRDFLKSWTHFTLFDLNKT